jgi:hypothetical protein
MAEQQRRVSCVRDGRNRTYAVLVRVSGPAFALVNYTMGAVAAETRLFVPPIYSYQRLCPSHGLTPSYQQPATSVHCPSLVSQLMISLGSGCDITFKLPKYSALPLSAILLYKCTLREASLSTLKQASDNREGKKVWIAPLEPLYFPAGHSEQ